MSTSYTSATARMRAVMGIAVAREPVRVALAVDPLVVGEHGRGHLAHALDAQQQARAVGRVALDQPQLGRVELAAADQDVIGQRLLAQVVQQAGGVDDRLLALGQPGRAGELVRVVGDRGGVAGVAGITQRERLQQQAEHALVAHVELVRAALDLLRVRLALQQRAQQQLVDAEGDREQADDPGAERLEAVDGHRGHHGGGDLPRQHRHEDAAEHVRQRAAAEDPRVAGDHQEVQEVGGQEHAEHRDGVGALVDVLSVQGIERDPAEQRERRVGEQVVEQVGAADLAPQRVDQRGGEAEQRGRGRPEQRHRQHEAGEGPADAEALRVQHEDVGAEHEQRDQADERERLPLALGREVARERQHGDQQHPWVIGRGPPPTRVGHASSRQPFRGRRRGISHRGGPHDGERPDDEAKPDDQCEPDDHREQVNAYPCSCAIRLRPEVCGRIDRYVEMPLKSLLMNKFSDSV